uniref:Uncharacterized protein n=1 Tax=Oryza glumipatula TaxID=40148 RepID=A0A0D9YKE0_9ORYZ
MGDLENPNYDGYGGDGDGDDDYYFTAMAERDVRIDSDYGLAAFLACLAVTTIGIGVLMVKYYRSHHGALAVFLLALAIFLFLMASGCGTKAVLYLMN